MKFILTIMVLSTFMICCKRSETNNTKQNTSIVEKKDSSIFDKYESWLSETKTVRPIKLYIDILRKIHKTLPNDSCKQYALESLANKEEFKKVMIEFKIFPYEDKYIFIRGFDCWSSRGIGTIYTLIDKNDSIISFKYDCLTEDTYPGGGRIDSIYLKDWNKNGSLDLMLHEYERISGSWNRNMHIYDLKISNNPFDLLFWYRIEGYSKTGMDRINQSWRDSVRVISPFLVEKISFDSTIVDKIKMEDYEDDDKKYQAERYRSKLDAQREMLKDFADRGISLNSTKKTLFKFDKNRKKFMIAQ